MCSGSYSSGAAHAVLSRMSRLLPCVRTVRTASGAPSTCAEQPPARRGHDEPRVDGARIAQTGDELIAEHGRDQRARQNADRAAQHEMPEPDANGAGHHVHHGERRERHEPHGRHGEQAALAHHLAQSIEPSAARCGARRCDPSEPDGVGGQRGEHDASEGVDEAVPRAESHDGEQRDERPRKQHEARRRVGEHHHQRCPAIRARNSLRPVASPGPHPPSAASGV